MKFVEHTEGGTRLVVPAASLTQNPPPTSPVFFNPAASLNRDISVAVAAADGGSTFCDSMAGVGARGLRVAKEVRSVKSVTLVDFNERALNLARRGAALNGVKRKCEFSGSETSSFLFSRYGREERFDYVDADPFGTPVRQLQAALCATSDGGVMSATATDTAVLCGVYPRVSKRRYGATPLNNHFSHESAIRILAGAIARMGASLDIGAEAVAAHSTRHYVRVFVRVMVGASRADASLGNLGYVTWCIECGDTKSSREPEWTCGACGRKAKVAGPLWIGRLVHGPTVTAARKMASEMRLASAADVLGSLEGVDGFPPWSFSIERICSTLRIPTVPEDAVYQRLLTSGHNVMRTPFEKTGIKTDADIEAVTSAVKGAATSAP